MLEIKDREINFNHVFNPKSIAVVGASPSEGIKPSITANNIANVFIGGLVDFGYKGKIYPVGPNGGTVNGLTIYPNIQQIPYDVEFAIAVIPNRLIPQLVEDCGRKGVKIIHLFASGFGEIEDKIGIELQKEILKTAARYGIRLIGPNCMGVYCPASRLTFSSGFSAIPGRVGFLSQSGGQSIMGVKEANRRGIHFSKVISYGNAADINECDLIEFFSADPETDIIVAYIEGTNDGPRLLRVLKAANERKPVIIFKGADTEGGSQAATSHTSSISGSNTIWASLIRQTGAIRVYNVKEMFDVVSILQRCTKPVSLNTLIIGQGGGSCVQASDECYKAGLKMPLLPPNLRQALKNVYRSEAGNMFQNPVDISPYWGMEKALQAFKAVSGWNGIDVVVLLATPEQTTFMERHYEYGVTTDTSIEWAKSSNKTTLLILSVNTMPGDDGLAEKSFNRIVSAGYAVFPSAERAAQAVALVYSYYQRHNKQGT